MFDSAIWLKKYGLLVKFILVILFFVGLNGLEIILPIYESSKVKVYYKYDNYLGYRANSPEDAKNFLERRNAADQEISIMLEDIKNRKSEIKLVDYFRYLDKLLDLEQKYKINLTGGTMYPSEKIHLACFAAMSENGNFSLAEEDMTGKERFYINAVRDKHSWLHDMPVKKGNLSINYLAVFSWLWKKYLQIMFFWLLIYVIRFQEKEKSIHRFKRHHNELNRFIDDQEYYPGSISLSEELLICPQRFLLRVLLWPFFCWKYPLYETTAEMIRFNRLKAEYLRYKPVGYQLSDREEIILRSKARAPVKDFAKTIKGIKEFQITPLIVRKSLATAYFSLVFGVLFQPAIVLASTYSQKANDHFYGQAQIVEVGHEAQFFDTQSADPPDESNSSWAIPVREFKHEEFLLVWRSAIHYLLIKPEEMIKEIFHVPLFRLFFGAAKVFQPLTV